MRPELLADRCHPGAARVAVTRGRAHLDQLVGVERAVDLREHLAGEALVADDDDGTELVGRGAQLAAPPGREGNGHRGSISTKPRAPAARDPA
jgi:hypothetical protein